jgi:hypothetical protein
MEQAYILIAILIFFLFYCYYSSKEKFENERQTKDCSRRALNDSIYNYNVDDINRGLRPI